MTDASARRPTRPRLERAKGILMADERINEDDAFTRLAKLSQAANLKLMSPVASSTTAAGPPSKGRARRRRR